MFVLWGGQGQGSVAAVAGYRAISCPVVGGVGGGGHDEITNKNINCL